MFLVNALTAVLAFLVAPLVFLWTTRRRWMTAITLVGAIYVLLPVQADQDAFWSSGATVLNNLQTMLRRVADDINALLECTDAPFGAWDRVAALVQAVLIVTADELGYEVPRGVPLTPAVYCQFVGTVAYFARRFVELIERAVFLFLDIVKAAISVIADIANLSFAELLVELIRAGFGELIGENCFDSWYSAWFCLCRGRWDSVDEVPTDPLELFAECLNPSYSGGDPIWEGLSAVFGLQPFKVLRDTALAAYNALLAVATRIAGIGSLISTAIDTLGGLVADMNTALSKVRNIGSTVEDIWDDITDIFDFSDDMALFRVYFDSVARHSTAKMAVVRSMLESGDFPRSERGPISRAGALGHVRNASRAIASTFLAELPGAWNRTLAAANMTADEAHMWGRFLAVAHAALASPVAKSAHQIADEIRAANISFARFAPVAKECPGRARAVLAHHDALRDMPRVDLSSYINFETLFGGVVILVIVVVAIALYPPAMAGPLIVLGGLAIGYALVFISGNSLQMLTAVATGHFDQALWLPTALYMANYAGRAYLQGGLLNFDADQFVAGLAVQIRNDAVYGLQLAADVPVCTGLITPFCLPPPVRGEDPLKRIVDALACEQGAACNVTYTVADCRGRAKACLSGACQCWLYLPTNFRVPRVTVVYNQPLDCTPYGYTNEGIIPRQTGGRLSWTNVWNNLCNTWAAARDVLRQLAHNRVPYWILGVLAFSFLPIVGPTAASTAVRAASVLAVQKLLVWGNDWLGWVGAPEAGFSCFISAAPSWGAGAIGIVVVVRIAVALLTTGALTALFLACVDILMFVGRVSTLSLRLAQPYAAWWNTRK